MLSGDGLSMRLRGSQTRVNSRVCGRKVGTSRYSGTAGSFASTLLIGLFQSRVEHCPKHASWLNMVEIEIGACCAANASIGASPLSKRSPDERSDIRGSSLNVLYPHVAALMRATQRNRLT
jgi:hypothetical protein